MRRVVITGLGLVTPLGNDLDSTWSGLMAGASGAGPTTLFDVTNFATKFSCEVKGWDPSKWFAPGTDPDRMIQFGVAASLMALQDAGFGGRVPSGQETRWGTYVGCGAGVGGVTRIEERYDLFKTVGAEKAFSPQFLTDVIVSGLPSHVAVRTGARGASFAQVSACATGSHSIGEAMRAIRYGYADGMIAGGAEAAITILSVGGFNAMRAMSTRNEDFAHASRPFDKERDGFVMGEGAGVLVLEELEMAKRRGARIYAELAGYASNDDAHHIAAPAPEHKGAQECFRLVLEDAKCDPHRIGYINAHGTSTPLNDKNETHAIKAVFGDHARQLAVSSTKSMTGHALGAAGGIEAAITTLAVARNMLPPTINYLTPDPECDLDYVPNVARECRVDAAMSNSFGFGGHNASLIITRYNGD